MESIDQFARKKYLNLEIFRRSGESMKTPVWFVQDYGLMNKMFALQAARQGRKDTVLEIKLIEKEKP